MAHKENKIRAAPINATQKDILVEFMKQHEDLQTGKFTKEFTFKKAQNLWEEIALKVNAVPGGAHKEWKLWRKTWQDLKKNVKSKVIKDKGYIYGTGGGPENVTILDKTENSILDMMPKVSTYGEESVIIPNSYFDFVGTNVVVNGNTTDTTNEQNTDAGKFNELLDEKVSRDQHATDHQYALDHVVTTSTPQNKKFKIVSKTRRLENSLKISQNLVTVEEQKKNVMENYYKEKIKFYQNKSKYENEKLLLLKKSNELRYECNIIQREILKELVNVKNTLSKD